MMLSGGCVLMGAAHMTGHLGQVLPESFWKDHCAETDGVHGENRNVSCWLLQR